jgi:hypothetical protein
MYGGSTGAAYIEKALPDSSAIVVVRWGSFDDGSNLSGPFEGCELWVGGKLIHNNSEQKNDIITTVPFKAGDVLRFNEPRMNICAIYSVKIQRRLFGCPTESSVPAGKGYTLDTQPGPPNALDYSGYALTFQGKTTNSNTNECCRRYYYRNTSTNTCTPLSFTTTTPHVDVDFQVPPATPGKTTNVPPTRSVSI